MSRRIALAGAALAIGLVPVAIATGAEGAKPPKKVVRVGDNFFAPDKLTVDNPTTVVWRWPREAGDVHDVYLTKRPAGVKRFRSELAASDYEFKRTLKVSGTYKLVCTIHEEMRMTIKVRK